MKFAYFKEVVSTGGSEGKLLQSVYPYRYLVHDAKFFPPAALLTRPTPISPLRSAPAAAALWDQWRGFWRPAAVFLDKSPENLLMAPYLQAVFGRRATAFVFVLRHPLSWALAAAKWACPWETVEGATPAEGGGAAGGQGSGGAAPKSPSLECVAHLASVWVAAHERMARDSRLLRSATVLRVEVQSWHTALAAAAAATGAAPPPDARSRWEAVRLSFLRSSHQYVHCYFRGAAPLRSDAGGLPRVGEGIAGGATAGPGGSVGDGSACGPASASASLERLAWLSAYRSEFGSRVAAIGFSLDLPRVLSGCCEGAQGDWGPEQVRPNAQAEEEEPDPPAASAAVAPPSYAAHATGGVGVGLHAGRVALVVSSSFLSGFNGMQQRAAQVAVAVGKLGFAVHFISLGELASVAECESAEVAVLCHAPGNTSAQYAGFGAWARRSRAAPTLLLLGFTSLTLEASRTLLGRPGATVAAWKRAGYGDEALLRLVAPRAGRSVELLDRALREWPMLRAAVFTDDVHHLRTRAILAQAGALAKTPSLATTLAALRSLEMGIYRRTRLTLTVSNADRLAILSALKHTAADAERPDPEVVLLPFGASALADSAVAPLGRRARGRMLYVGTCHPVAKAGVAWMLAEVMPKLVALGSAAGLSPSLVLVGNGWAALQTEAPFERWVGSGALQVCGRLSASELRLEYDAAWLFVAPLRNATGIATKNFHAMGMGLPVLTTAMGVSGMHLPGRELGLCCDASPSGAWPNECKLGPRAGRGRPPPARPTLEEDCRRVPKRLECAALRAARLRDGGGRGAGSPEVGGPGVEVGGPGVEVRGPGAGGPEVGGPGVGGRALLSGLGAPWRSLLTADGSLPDARPLVVLRGGKGSGGAGPAGGLRVIPTPSHASLHPSGAALVTDDPSAFASAAVAALTDDSLWRHLSRRGLRQMRMLVSPARQAAVLSAAMRDPLLLDAPAEQACVLLVDACAPRAEALAMLRRVLSALFSLRVAVHILVSPAAVQPATELDLLGWLRTQGAFTYAGDAAEQWTAILGSAAAPPLRFAVLLHEGEPALLRSLAEPHCQGEVKHHCIWEGGAMEDEPVEGEDAGGSLDQGMPEEGEEEEREAAAAQAASRNALRISTEPMDPEPFRPTTALGRSLLSVHADLRSQGRDGPVLSEAHGVCGASAPSTETSLSLLRLLDCIVRAQQLPLLTILAGATRPSGSTSVVGSRGVAAEYERALLAKATLALGGSETELRHLRTFAPRVPAAAMPSGSSAEAQWVEVLSKLLYPE